MRLIGTLIEPVLAAIEELHGLGAMGRIGYVVGLSMWTLLCLPTTPVELAAGFIFPSALSSVMSALGKTFGSLAALLLGRRLLKPLITRAFAKSYQSKLHQHLLHELRENPIQTMSILRAAPLPTPFKIYGLSLFPPELVPFSTYAGIALTFNSAWSLVWTLTSSSASSLQDALSGSGNSSAGALAGKVSILFVLFGSFAMFGRYAKSQLQPIDVDSRSEADVDAMLPNAKAAPAASEAERTTRSVSRRRSVLKSPALISSKQPSEDATQMAGNAR